MGLCVPAPLRPSVCGARKDRCRLGRQMVVLWACWGFGGTPGRCAGARWDGEALGKSISAISALIAAYTVAFRTLVVGGQQIAAGPAPAGGCTGEERVGRPGDAMVSRALESCER